MGAMRDLQNAINQALGLPEHARHHSHWHYNEYGKTERKKIHEKDQPKNPRGDRRVRGGKVEKPMDFYKRQRAEQDERDRIAREKQEDIARNQGRGGNPTQGKWGGIW